MSNPLVSVGISFFNGEDCLLNAIRSIFAQTLQNWELLLVDDGSTDKSLDIARSIDDPRVRVLPPDGQNRRLAARLNQIAQAARGDYIARMDADDLCHPERFAKQLEFFKTHPDVDIVGTSSCILDKHGQPARKLVVGRTHEEIFKNKYKGISVVHPSVMSKADWFRRWPYDENRLRAQDLELWLRSCRDSVFANIPDILYFTNEFLSFRLSKYISSTRTAIRVRWRYSRPEIGWFKAAYKSFKLYLHVGVHAGTELLGLHDKLINRRRPYSSLNLQEYAEVEAALDIIRKTEVPIRPINHSRKSD